MAPMRFVGVDGCKGGWFSAGLGQNGYDFGIFRGFAELLSHYGDAEIILVDIPIGLPEGPGGRKCDNEARKKLGYPRQLSVFPTPTRLTAYVAAEPPPNIQLARDIERQISGKGLSSQSFAIAPKIAEVDGVLLNPDRKAKPEVREVHPELCFWALNSGQAMESKKKSKEGAEERLNVLRKILPPANVDDVYNDACSKFSRKNVAKDDILDALAAAVTAWKGYAHLQTVPEDPPKDPKCLPMEMVYWRPVEQDGKCDDRNSTD